MTEIHRWSIWPRYRAEIIDLFPQVTAAQLARLDDLIVSERFLTDAGEPHPCLINWVRAVLDWGGDAPGLADVPPPAPRPTPSTAEVML